MKPVATVALKFLQGYPQETLVQVQQMLDGARLAPWLLQKYPSAHCVRTDRTLYDYVQTLKTEHLRGAEPLSAYFSPSWTAFQADRGRDFSVIVDGISN